MESGYLQWRYYKIKNDIMQNENVKIQYHAIFLSIFLIAGFFYFIPISMAYCNEPRDGMCGILEKEGKRVRRVAAAKIDSIKKDYRAHHQGFRESLIMDIKGLKEIRYLTQDADCLDIVGYLVYTKLPDIDPKPKPESEEESCKKHGGGWISSSCSCNLPTSDAGKECSDGSECDGACLAEKEKPGEPAPTKGKCSEWTIVLGCRYFVTKGVAGMICVD